MSRDQITMNCKLYSLIGLAKLMLGLQHSLTWLTGRCSAAEIWLTATATHYRR
jgi:hypothetical protein